MKKPQSIAHQNAVSPSTEGIGRREAVLAAAAVSVQAVLLGWPGPTGAQSTASGVGAVSAADGEAIQRFLAFSRAITGHDDVDVITAGRIRAAMVGGDAAFAQTADVLAALVQPGIAPDTLLSAAEGAGLRDAALAVVSAWYTGTVGTGTKVTVVAYEQALMYRPVADGLTVPTYCNEGPIWWTGAPPEAGVAPPKEAARRAPAPPPVMRAQGAPTR